MPRIPTYTTPANFRCPECGQECKIIANENEFSYPGTHCTHGRGGTEYPSDWGNPISDCCEAEIEDISE